MSSDIFIRFMSKIRPRVMREAETVSRDATVKYSGN